MVDQTLSLLPKNTPVESPRLSALDHWDAGQMTAPLPKAELQVAIADLEPKMQPATDEEFARAMLLLTEFVTSFGIPAPNPRAIQKAYREALKHLPGDLLSLAVARIKIRWTMGMRMPFPAEILGTVKDDYNQRWRRLFRAKAALKKAEPKPAREPINPEEVERILARYRSRRSSADPTPSAAAPEAE